MGSTHSPSDYHLVFAPFPAYGHVRPCRSLAISLAKLGYSITFMACDYYKKSLTGIPNIEYVSFTGKLVFDPADTFANWPDRPHDAPPEIAFPWDTEHIFFDAMDEQFANIQAVLSRPELADKKVVLLTEGIATGAVPILLESPQARRVPVIALAGFPLINTSRDTAPMGMGPSQGPEKNMQLNAMVTGAFANCQANIEKKLEKYECTKQMPSKFPWDTLFQIHDAYLSLTVPEMEPPRSDLPEFFDFVGHPTGGNLKPFGEVPDWWQEFVVDDNSKPLIVVTSGTLSNMSATELIIPTLQACADLPVRVVVCSVYVDLPADMVVPSNARVAQWLPFEDLFAHASIVVSNGGYGGIQQAFAAGLPMVVAGTTQDKAITTARAAETGAAINLETQTPGVEQVKGAIERVWGEEGFRETARTLQRSYAERDTLRLVEERILGLGEKFYA